MSFADDLAKFERKANSNMATVVRKVAIQIGDSLVQMSPVDTGRFRANWIAGIGRIDATTTEETANSASGRIDAVIASPFGPNRSRYDFDSAIYITNSLPYAQRLEFGHSRQAPGGMVRITAARFGKFVNAAAVGLS